MSYNADDLFKGASEKRKQNREKESQKKSFSGRDYENAVYTSLSDVEGKVIRILGNPLLMRREPTDPKLSFVSHIVGDNGKKFRCIWPDRSEQPDWILWKVLNTVLENHWENDKDTGKGHQVYHHAKTHPECFTRVYKNNSDNKYEKGWYPTAFVNMNVIDREDMEYHAEKKHSKLLSKKAKEIGDSGKFWYDPGVPRTAYNAIWDEVVEYAGNWVNYDVVLRKLKADPWYRAFHGVDDFKKLSEQERSFVVEGPLTEDEKAYELYDLDQLFKITSYMKIKSRLGEFIKKVDIDFKKNFYTELEKLAEQEKAEYEAKNEQITDNDEEDMEEEQQEETKVRPTRTKATEVKEEERETIDWDALADGSFNGKEYLGVPKMTEEEKAMVLAVKEDGSFKYVKTYKGEPVELFNNPTTDFHSPGQYHVDPLSGDEF